MRARILEAALRVLREDGALAFTTTSVADAADISVGSLYQYFPNKRALVVALHREAIEAGWRHVQAVLDDPARGPRTRIEDIARWYFGVEAEEAGGYGAVFDDVEVFLRGAPGDEDLGREALERFTTFVRDASTATLEPEVLERRVQVLMTTLEAVGKAIATRPLAPDERERWATEVATMVCDLVGLPDDERRAAGAKPRADAAGAYTEGWLSIEGASSAGELSPTATLPGVAGAPSSVVSTSSHSRRKRLELNE